ncbi:MAG: ribonuclease BN [Chloroflexi bacterium HGW-Chloroflexi-4]|jgi:membrane protein|nr:MAG: ribonuclease BN [Chloroflexi bacterium HGW-Chloroflexi-4]
MLKLKTIWAVVSASFQAWTDDNAAQLSAAIAFYTIFSIPPLLIIAMTIAGNIFDTETAKIHIISQISNLIGIQTGELVKTILENSQQQYISPLSSIFSVVILIIVAAGFFYQIQFALNKIWKVPKKQDLNFFKTLKNRSISFLLILAIGLLFIIVLILSVFLSEFLGKAKGIIQNAFLWNVLNFLILFFTVTILFAIIYRVIPDKETSWTVIWLGATITGLLFMFGKFGIGIYLSISKTGSAYGTAGSLIVLLIWIYFSTIIFLLGAEFTHVFSKRFGIRKNTKMETKFGFEKVPDQNDLMPKN